LFGLIAIGGVVAITLVGMNSGTDRYREVTKKRTAETVGTVTNADIGTATTANYTYEYVVNGVSHRGTNNGVRARGDSRFRDRVGKKGVVCYDPSEPDSSEFYFSEYESYAPCRRK
jgi:hypothetical protein